MFINSYSTLSKIFEYEFIWDEIADVYIHKDSYFKHSFKSRRRACSRIIRKNTKKEIHNLRYKKDIENDTFPVIKKSIRWDYY